MGITVANNYEIRRTMAAKVLVHWLHGCSIHCKILSTYCVQVMLMFNDQKVQWPV